MGVPYMLTHFPLLPSNSVFMSKIGPSKCTILRKSENNLNKYLFVKIGVCLILVLLMKTNNVINNETNNDMNNETNTEK